MSSFRVQEKTRKQALKMLESSEYKIMEMSEEESPCTGSKFKSSTDESPCNNFRYKSSTEESPLPVSNFRQNTSEEPPSKNHRESPFSLKIQAMHTVQE